MTLSELFWICVFSTFVAIIASGVGAIVATVITHFYG